jgi:hypothetical protein
MAKVPHICRSKQMWDLRAGTTFHPSTADAGAPFKPSVGLGGSVDLAPDFVFAVTGTVQNKTPHPLISANMGHGRMKRIDVATRIGLIVPLEFSLQIAINPEQEDDGGSCVKYGEFYVVTEVGNFMHVTSLDVPLIR